MEVGLTHQIDVLQLKQILYMERLFIVWNSIMKTLLEML